MYFFKRNILRKEGRINRKKHQTLQIVNNSSENVVEPQKQAKQALLKTDKNQSNYYNIKKSANGQYKETKPLVESDTFNFSNASKYYCSDLICHSIRYPISSQSARNNRWYEQNDEKYDQNMISKLKIQLKHLQSPQKKRIPEYKNDKDKLIQSLHEKQNRKLRISQLIKRRQFSRAPSPKIQIKKQNYIHNNYIKTSLQIFKLTCQAGQTNDPIKNIPFSLRKKKNISFYIK